jgi:hypothetical protein
VHYFLLEALKSVGKKKQKNTHSCDCYPTCESDEYVIEEIQISEAYVLSVSKFGDLV